MAVIAYMSMMIAAIGLGFFLVFKLAPFGVSIWASVEFGFLRDTSGSNQYGPDPLVAQ